MSDSSVKALFDPTPGNWNPGYPFFALYPQGQVMDLIVWLVIGGLVGWFASLVLRANADRKIVLNVVGGIAGSLVAGWLIAPKAGVTTINDDGILNPQGLTVSLVGALVLLVAVNLPQRRRGG
jgi:uncharacterized membrane protein YeaQ/YmgE (transglycosylase-associated protein family)